MTPISLVRLQRRSRTAHAAPLCTRQLLCIDGAVGSPRLTPSLRRSEDSDNEELEVDLGEEWDPGCEHLFDLHSFYDGLSSLRTPSTASPCQSASWYDAALAGGPMHEWLRSAEVAGRDADPRGAAPRGGSSSRQSRARPDMQRTSSRFSCDDVFVQVSA